MDGAFYIDSRMPFMATDQSPLTIIGTNKAYIPAGSLPVLGSNYFNFVGKQIRMRAFGKLSSAATPGTQTFTWLWGTGADANGTAILTSGVITPAASLTTASWMWEIIVTARALGASGSVFAFGQFKFINSNTTTTAGTMFMLPPSAPAAVTIDTTAANVISPQVLATTSTTNTITAQAMTFEALN